LASIIDQTPSQNRSDRRIRALVARCSSTELDREEARKPHPALLLLRCAVPLDKNNRLDRLAAVALGQNRSQTLQNRNKIHAPAAEPTIDIPLIADPRREATGRGHARVVP